MNLRTVSWLQHIKKNIMLRTLYEIKWIEFETIFDERLQFTDDGRTYKYRNIIT